MGSLVHKTWEEFWGPLFLVRFHAENQEGPEVARKRRAQWMFDLLDLQSGSKVLNLGCGDGILDICLAKIGAKVIGVDRLRSVLKQAHIEGAEHPVHFVVGDIRDISFFSNAFDVVCLFEVAGLMNATDDKKLIKKVFEWIRPGGHFLIDCPKEPEELSSYGERIFSDGLLSMSWSYDPETRMQSGEPKFHRFDSITIDLVDPYDPSRAEHSGLRRYLYTPTELTCFMNDAGLEVTEAPHFERPHLFLLKGTKPY